MILVVQVYKPASDVSKADKFSTLVRMLSDKTGSLPFKKKFSP